jgi:perosamine synthetase
MSHKKSIPLIKPVIGEKEIAKVEEVLLSGMLAEGSQNKQFEKEFSEFTDAKYAITTTNGTSALFVALEALGIGPGDEIITVGFTFIASSNAILHVGAIPVFVDIDHKTWTIDPEEVKKAITPRTKAIMPVHIFGTPSNMNALREIAKEHNLFIIEDACQAHGAKYDGKHVGSIGDIGCFSLYATKNLMAGEGGVIVTDDEELANRCKSIKNHGREAGKFGGYSHYRIGYNFRMTDFNAAIALSQLNRLPEFLEIRKRNAELYKELLKDIDQLTYQQVPDKGQHCYYIFACALTDDNYTVKDIVNYLREHGIGSRPIYSTPAYKQPAYQSLQKDWKWGKYLQYPNYSDMKLPVTEKLAKTHFEIPVNQVVTEDDVKYVYQKIKEYFN